MTRPDGALGKVAPLPQAELAAIPTHGLAEELLARVRRGDSLTGQGGRAELFAVLAMELEIRADHHDNRFSRVHLATALEAVHAAVPGGLDGLTGKVVVDLGCGSVNPLAFLFALVLCGARQGIGIDLDAVSDVAAACRGLARCATYLLTEPRLLVGDFPVTRAAVAARLGAFDVVKLWEGQTAGLDPSRLAFRREPAEHTSLGNGAADLVTSFAFLEHVPDPDAVVAELARITAPGGFGLHTIDGTDHRRYADTAVHPLAFLGEAPGAAMVAHSNRWRPLQFLDLFRRHGFEVLRADPHLRVPVDAALRAGFVAPFRGMDQELLEVASLLLAVRRT